MREVEALILSASSEKTRKFPSVTGINNASSPVNASDISINP